MASTVQHNQITNTTLNPTVPTYVNSPRTGITTRQQPEQRDITTVGPRYLNQQIQIMATLAQIHENEKESQKQSPYASISIATGSTKVHIQADSGASMHNGSISTGTVVEQLANTYERVFAGEWEEKLTAEEFKLYLRLLSPRDVISTAVEGGKAIGAAIVCLTNQGGLVEMIQHSAAMTMKRDLTDEDIGHILSAIPESGDVLYFSEIFIDKGYRHLGPNVFVKLLHSALHTMLNLDVSPNTQVVFFTSGKKDKEGRTSAVYHFAKMLGMKPITLPTLNEEERYAFKVGLGSLDLLSSPIVSNAVIQLSRAGKHLSRFKELLNWINTDEKEA